jgi:hypothetical protein
MEDVSPSSAMQKKQTVTGVIPMSPVTARAYLLKEEFSLCSKKKKNVTGDMGMSPVTARPFLMEDVPLHPRGK